MSEIDTGAVGNPGLGATLCEPSSCGPGVLTWENLGNPVARWSNDQQALFYQLLCPGKAAQNAAFICGTNVVLRAAAPDTAAIGSLAEGEAGRISVG